MAYRISDHAYEEMERRGIELKHVEAVMDNPGQIIPEKNNRNAYQSQIDFGDGKMFLLRIIVEENDPAVIVTLYRTSKIDKYWRPS